VRLFDNTSLKLTAILFSTFEVIVTTPLLYGIICFETNAHHRQLRLMKSNLFCKLCLRALGSICLKESDIVFYYWDQVNTKFNSFIFLLMTMATYL